MKQPVGPTRSKCKAVDTPVAAGLSWREFFVRLGEGTLHDDAATQTRREAPDENRPSRKRPTVTASR